MYARLRGIGGVHGIFSCHGVGMDLHSFLRAVQEVSGLHFKTSMKTDACKIKERTVLEPYAIFILHAPANSLLFISLKQPPFGMLPDISCIFNISDNNSSESQFGTSRFTANVRKIHPSEESDNMTFNWIRDCWQ